MESQQQHRKTRENSSRQAVSGDFRVEMTGTQESLDLDSGKFYTVNYFKSQNKRRRIQG
jgi:hypothetical protein